MNLQDDIQRIVLRQILKDCHREGLTLSLVSGQPRVEPAKKVEPRFRDHLSNHRELVIQFLSDPDACARWKACCDALCAVNPDYRNCSTERLHEIAAKLKRAGNLRVTEIIRGYLGFRP